MLVFFQFLHLNKSLGVSTWVRAFPRLLPEGFSLRATQEWVRLHSVGIILLVHLGFVLGTLDRAVEWILDIDVGSWPRVGRFDFFVNRSDFGACESNMNCLLLDNLVFYGIFLFLMVISAWSWILMVSLLGKRRLSFILPEITYFGLGSKTGRFLAYVGSLRVGSLVLVGSFFHGLSDLVFTRSRVVRLKPIVIMVHFRTSIGGVRNLRSEVAVLTCLIVSFLVYHYKIVGTWAWKHLDLLSWIERLSLSFRGGKVRFSKVFLQ